MVRWDSHNTKSANGILFFMEMGIFHQCFLTYRNHQEEWQSLLGDRMSYMILSWWCDDNCFECACLYLGWQWRHTLLTPCIWSIPSSSDAYSDRKLQCHCRESKYWQTVITAYQLEHSLRGQNFSHNIWGKRDVEYVVSDHFINLTQSNLRH